MKTRIAFATSIAAMFLCTLPATYAEVARVHPPMHALFSKGEKMIKLNFRNNTGAPFELKIGDKVSTLREGEVMGFKMPIGTRVLANTATEHHVVGALVFEASTSTYNDSTVVINK